MEASSVPTRGPAGDGQADPTAGTTARHDVNFVPTPVADPGPDQHDGPVRGARRGGRP
jgi:hypothetical protein